MDARGTAWDIVRYEWLHEDRDFESLYPSRQCQPELNQKTGRFEIIRVTTRFAANKAKDMVSPWHNRGAPFYENAAI